MLYIFKSISTFNTKRAWCTHWQNLDSTGTKLISHHQCCTQKKNRHKHKQTRQVNGTDKLFRCSSELGKGGDECRGHRLLLSPLIDSLFAWVRAKVTPTLCFLNCIPNMSVYRPVNLRCQGLFFSDVQASDQSSILSLLKKIRHGCSESKRPEFNLTL